MNDSFDAADLASLVIFVCLSQFIQINLEVLLVVGGNDNVDCESLFASVFGLFDLFILGVPAVPLQRCCGGSVIPT